MQVMHLANHTSDLSALKVLTSPSYDCKSGLFQLFFVHLTAHFLLPM